MRIDHSSATTETCPSCGRRHEQVSGFISNDDGPFAVYFAQPHPDGHSAWIDVVLGTWGTTDPVRDHVNFSCVLSRYGVQLVDAPAAGNPGGWMGGVPLNRNEAQVHPWLHDFQSVVDFLAAHDATVRAYLLMPPSVDSHAD